MSLTSKVGSFQVSTGAVNATQSITGVGFQPSLVLFWSTARTETATDTTSRQNVSNMFGFAISSSKRAVTLSDSTDNATNGSSNWVQGSRNDACVAHGNPGGTTFAGWLDLTSMDSDGFTLKVGSQYSTAYTVHFLALGGSGVQVDGGLLTITSGTGNKSLTGMSFQPSTLLLSGGASTALNSLGTSNSGAMFGMAVGTGAGQQAVVKGTWESAVATHSQSYGSTGLCYIAGPTFTASAGTATTQATLNSFNSDGFTLNFSVNGLAANSLVLWVALNVSSAVGGFSTHTGTGNFSVSGLGITPIAVLAFSHCLAQSSGQTTQLGESISVGAFTSSSNRGAQAFQVQDNGGTGNSNVGSSIQFDKVYVNISSSNTVQGSIDAVSLDSTGFTLNQIVGDPQANFVAYLALGTAVVPTTDKSYNSDVYVFDQKVSYNVDVFLPTTIKHNIDVYAQFGQNVYNADVFVQTPFVGHSVDVYVLSYIQKLFARVLGQILFKIDPNAYIRIAGTVLSPNISYIQVAGNIASKSNPNSVNVGGTLQVKSRNLVRVIGTLLNDKKPSYSVDVIVSVKPATDPLSFVRLAGTIVAKVNKSSGSLNFPDTTYVKIAGKIIKPASANDSVQMPGQGFTKADDWLSSQDALASYKPGSIFTIFDSSLPAAGISLIVTAFTAGVVSAQTRTRTWLRRVDAASSGILLTTEVNTHTLPNGAVITTTTTKTQQQDTLITTVKIQNSATPTRISTVVTEKSGSGQTVTKESETNTINGVVNSLEKKTVTSKPPTTDNVQPLQVRTLDGIIHYQFFGSVNKTWAGGDREGVTSTSKAVSIQPGALNGSTTDSFGNLIYNQVTDETVTDPSGRVIETHTEEIGTRKDIGTITTNTTEGFVGLQKTTTKTVTNPDGSKVETVTVSNPVNGDTVETSTETVTDEFGQTTTTVTKTETVTFQDTSGTTRQTSTKTVSVTKGGVTTTDTTVVVNNDFEDDIINQKIKEYLIQEFTITCVIDEMSMGALAEINMTHQRNYALLELFGQQLGNGNLSYLLRQKLIQQFNQANNAISPVTLQALGKQYKVVFAQSAASFREKYIVGTEPHVYELQIILQSRSDLVTGTFGF